MRCKTCGVDSDSEGKPCPNCGHASPVIPAVVGVPGTVGTAMANGSDEVRNSKTATPEAKGPPLANPGRPPGEVIEGTGG
jgi:hypothetical protein